MKIHFNNNIIKNYKLSWLTPDKVFILTKDSPNITGFKIYENDMNLLGDYSDFTTLYAQEKDGYILSNNKSIQIEFPEPVFSNEGYEPSNQDKINAQLMKEIAMLKAGAK